ncbi:MAG: hypothetical protein A2758_01370 [Candidatus Zambryskibacteria bacterium RIFCSPHIGHO2_01_FULL_49_18]|uniref:Uncharacterized protein n=2 Tax=Candidatus Zambryskiibacteriota TaxID=1817925 RepID=A0A1G2T359_9BACT|nr:MAG: hypothetical protein A2758_01370 [Candidatus Zambryskibacteria bacterium RIFCSPHIGHO2_01_FULL_49_18]OHB05308.1 MAG: hypothetical protein A3A26_01825 [Candidatus Zambryskibacteria bacterium RIFCSPLOWO2_01_FULL_47_14]
MDKKLIIILLSVLLAGLGYWWWQRAPQEGPEAEVNPFAKVEVNNPFEESSNPYEDVKTNPFE